MKKLMLMLAAVAALTFVSCDIKTATNNNAGADSTFTIENFTENLTNATDSAAVVGLLDKANAEVQALIAKGDTIGAQDLLAKIKEVIATNKEKLVAIVPSIEEVANKTITLPEGLKEAAAAAGENLEEAAAGVKDAAAAEVEKGAEKLNEAAEKGAEKVNEAAGKAADAGKEAINKGAQKANDAVNKAAEDLKNKLPR